MTISYSTNAYLKLESHSGRYLQSLKLFQHAIHELTMGVMHVIPLYTEVIHLPRMATVSICNSHGKNMAHYKNSKEML